MSLETESFNLKVILPSGKPVVTRVQGNHTLGQVREACWHQGKELGFQGNKTDPVFRLYTNEIYFGDNETVYV